MKGRKRDYRVEPSVTLTHKLKALAIYLGEKGYSIHEVASPLRRHDSDFIALKENGAMKLTLFRATKDETIEVRSYESQQWCRNILLSLGSAVYLDLGPFTIGKVLPIKFINSNWRKLIVGPIV